MIDTRTAEEMLEERKPETTYASSIERSTDRLQQNPWRFIEMEPTYWGLEGTVVDFCLAVLNGYIWEMDNTPNFIAVHEERPRVIALRDRFAWLRSLDKDDEYKVTGWWPQQDELTQLALVDFARLVPELWD